MLLLLACAPADFDVGDDRPDRRPPRDTDEVEVVEDPDTDIEVLDDTGAPDTDTAPAPDATRIFNLDAIHTIELTLAEGGRRALAADPYTYVAADMKFDGEDYPDVGLRLKGRLGSFRSLDQKAAFKVDLLEFDADHKLEGLEKFNLNNMVQDCAKVHEYAAYGVHRLLGTPAPRVAYAQVYVDGQDYGLYSLVEDYDDEFLQANFADPTGNLYDGDYHLWPNGSYTLVDFTDAGQAYFELDEGTDVGMSDVHAVTDALRAGATFSTGLQDRVDLEQHAAFVAASAWTGHSDSYSYYSNNYRVYFDPARGGRAVFLPWDPDWAFYSATAVTTFYGSVSGRCHADPTCNAALHAALDTLDTTVPGSALEAELQAAIDLIRPALRADPRLETGMAEIDACQADLFAWFLRRGAEIDASGL